MTDVALKLLDWEREDSPRAPLTAKQRDSVVELAACFASRPLPARFQSVPDNLTENNADIENKVAASENGADSKVRTVSSEECPTVQLSPNFLSLFDKKIKLETAHQFYEWFAEIENEMTGEEDAKYRIALKELQEYSLQCSGLLNEVDVCLNHLKSLHQQYQLVSNKTNSLHEACEHLLAEQTKLVTMAENISEKLLYFNEADKISQKLSSPTLSVTNESFIPMLARIDECIEFLVENPNYKESAQYLAKFRHCLARALNMIHMYVVKSLQNAAQQVLPSKDSSKPLENSFTLFYGKFQTNAARIKILMEQIETRIHHSSEYEQLLSDCHHCYFTQRELLISSSVSAAVLELAATHQRDHCTLVRSGCNLLLHICEDEHQLFFQFFSKPGEQLNRFLEKLCTRLYDVLRPLIIHVNHLETLAELCSILKIEMLEEHIHNSAVRLTAFETFVTQLLQDVQERLVYRSHVYIQTDILNYKPAPGDLAYPEKLEMMASIAESLAQTRLSRTDSQSSLISSSSVTSQEVAAINASNESQSVQPISYGYSPADLHGMWYPTVRRTLSCLSKLYRCISKSIFQGLSQEALAMCIQSLIVAGDSISKNQTPLDGQLFQIKHLLILREQITPFQVDFSIRETALDFSKVKSAAVNLFHRRSRLFSFSSSNAFLEFIVQGTPQVTEHFLDSKKDVDNHLKAVCDSLITHCTVMLTGPLTAFLEKANVIVKVGKQESERQVLLRNQPFASTEQVAGIVTEANRQLKSKLPALHHSMSIYLANKETEAILFRPIKTNIINGFQQLQEIVRAHYPEEDQVIIGCPSLEQVNVMLSR